MRALLLPVHADAEADDARRHDRLDLIRVRVAVAVFCVPRIAWIVFEFVTLKTSSDGMNRTFADA